MIICMLLIVCCACWIILYISYNHGKLRGQLTQQHAMERHKFSTTYSPRKLFITPTSEDMKKLSDDAEKEEQKMRRISVDFNESDCYNINSIPIYENKLEIQDLNDKYKLDIKYPFYYYFIEFLHFMSILINFIILLYYIDINKFDILYIYCLLYFYLFINYFLNIYTFCHFFIQLILLNIFLYFCNWSIFSFIIFISIYIFQLTSKSIIGMINNDICDLKQFKRHYKNGKKNKFKKLKKYLFENLRFLILFSNFELLPLFIYKLLFSVNYHDNDVYIIKYKSILYQFMLVFIIWINCLIPFYIKYMLRFGEYFNPKKHCNHFIIAIYYRLYIIISILWKLFNIYLCSIFIYLNFNKLNYKSFEFIYNLFIICFGLILIIFIPFSLSLYRYCCCCFKEKKNKCKNCFYWFFGCKLQHADI